MQEKVTIILPVSRHEYLSSVFTALEMLDCDRKQTNLISIVDGDDDLFIKVRNHVNSSKFNEVLAIPYSKRGETVTDLFERRKRIADIHNELKLEINNCTYVMGVEDDTVVPPKALKYLLEDFVEKPHAGFIQGVELGRWGKPYVGGWTADDLYEPTVIKSIMPSDTTKSVIEPIDAGGFFCFMSKKDKYTSHDFQPFENNGMGPDAEYGMTLRQLGYSNFIDWRIRCTHLTKDEKISLETHKPVPVKFIKHQNRHVWQFSSK